MQPTSQTKVNYTQEIRFAIVMYGGVSLAIYMNGVAQELLRLVRATAPESVPPGSQPQLPHLSDDQLKGAEKVYRKLGQMLVRGKPALKCDESKSETDDRESADSRPISTRFIIDILSGSSAGGINAIFLAKALANDQDMSQLRDMWVKEGDIALLLNDKKSDEGIELGQQTPPRSLLNSRRMYHKLLDALYGMEKRGARQPGTTEENISPYADEIDLFTTATDNWGRVINLRLADGIASERRHLNKFHFRYCSKRADEKGHNDFVADNNPFLAFAARCTSAHQSSFEPMKLADIDESLEKHEGYKSRPTIRSGNAEWRSFYQTYLRRSDTRNAIDDPKLKDSLAEKFKTRPFSDGGALDNSPFTFAIDQLQHRQADLPVERKLMYVEPVPEHPEETTDPQRPPDAIKNAWLALSELPRYQFIREDLERLLERNRLVERVNRIVDGIERDEMVRLRKARATRPETKERLTWEDFSKEDIGGMIGRMGSAWGGYHRLRVAETTDEMERIISQAAGFDPESAESQAVRHLVRTWRMQNFDAYGKGTKGTLPDSIKSDATMETLEPNVASALAEPKETENSFLYKYDLKWRVRRLKFVLKKLDEISCFDDNLKIILGAGEHAMASEESPDTMFAEDLSRFLDQGINEDKKNEVEDDFRKELQTLKGELSSVLIEMVGATRSVIPSPGGGQKSGLLREEDNLELIKAFDKLKDIKRERLIDIAERQTDEARTVEAAKLLKTNAADFDTFLRGLNTKYQAILLKAATRVEGAGQTSVRKPESHAAETSNSTITGILEVPATPPSALTLEFIARRALRYYYDNFDRYDMITYPLFYATSVGEERDVVDVYRISPEDATSLFKHKPEAEAKALLRRKLAGTSLSNFGAFFDERFRINDIFWGRLDCAERIITALLPASPDYIPTKNRLIDEAHRAIIAEEFESADRAGISALVSTLMVQDQPGEQKRKFLEAFDKLLKGDPAKLKKIAGDDSRGIEELQKFIQFSLAKEPKDPLQHFVETYNFNYTLNPQTLVRTAGRASKIFGSMLEGIAETHRIDKSRVVWVTRLGQLFWSLVEVAVPGSISNLVLKHWLKLLYLFEFLLIFFGTLLLSPTIQRFGILTFALTVALHTGALVLGDTMSGEKNPWERIKSLFIIVVVIAALFGGFFLVSFFFNVGTWKHITAAQEWYANDKIPLWQRMLYAAPIIIISLLFLRFALRDCDKATPGKTEIKNES